MITTEEFTFPVLVSAAGASMDSPPLWRHVGPAQAASTSSASTTSSSKEEGDEREQLHSSCIHTNVTLKARQRKSFSGVGGHDTMDLLWEKFNEDLPRNRSPFECNSATTDDDDDDDDDGGLLEFGCVATALNLSKAVTGSARRGADGGRAVIAKNKKLRLVVLAKVLKRLFLLQHQSLNKRSW